MTTGLGKKLCRMFSFAMSCDEFAAAAASILISRGACLRPTTFLLSLSRHRGLRNCGQAIRPVVYLTYSSKASGKEFRDSVNFSRKRYHKLGDIAEKPLTREERAQKRRRQEK